MFLVVKTLPSGATHKRYREKTSSRSTSTQQQQRPHFTVDTSRKIIHIDMDAFFASVEQLDNPELKGRPVIVGGDPRGRGVVAACSYEARVFGIHSAMSCAQAYKLCREAVFVPPRKDRYSQVSGEIMKIFFHYTDLVEPLSVDEAFLDITVNHKNIPSATWAAEAIRQDIFKATGLTASAGVSYNKFLAKIASDQNKPDGITVITPEQAFEFIRQLPIRKFYGVGRVTEKKMQQLGIFNGRDLQHFSRPELVEAFGKSGHFFFNIAHGHDDRPVQVSRVRKSIGSETTLKEDINDLEAIGRILASLGDKVADSLARRETGGRTLCLKVRYSDFTTITRSCTSATGFFNSQDIAAHIPRLLAATEAGRRKVRLLGVTVSNFTDKKEVDTLRFRQLPLPFHNKL